MSIPLLKKSLELVNTDYDYSQVKDKSKNDSSKQPVVNVSKKKSGCKDLRGVADVRNCNVNKVRLVRKKIKKYQQNIAYSLYALNYLKRPCIDKKLADVILERNNKPKIEEFVAVKESQGTVFTEEDFAKFEECLRNEG